MSAGKKTTAVVDTLRFDVDLAPPTDDTTNEFSYAHLLKEREAAKNNASSSMLISDPDNNSDENLAALAKKFEEKYGSRKRKRVLHESDLIDRGLGYDLADSFVDDSEMYENYVPHQLDTRFGGFYINTGKLEFKTADEDDIDDEMDFIVKKKKAKPRVNTFQSTPQALLASQKLKKAKQRAAMQKNPSSLKKSSSVLNTSVASSPTKPPLVKKHKQTGLARCLIPSNGNVAAASGSPLLSSSSSLAATSSQDKTATTHAIKTVNLSSKLGKDAARASTADMDANKISNTTSGEMLAQVPKEPPVLSDKLPPLLLEKVTNLEQLILKDIGTSGKLSIKTRITYDEHLVDIHLHSLMLTKKMRNGVFEYLAYKMGVAKGTLIKRLKQEMRKREDIELAADLLNLKKAIDLAMPEQIVLFEREVRARAESVSEMEEDSKMGDVFDESTNMSAISATQTAAGGGQEKIKKAPPRKRFKWTEEIKKLLCAVVKTKVASEEKISKASKTCSGEEAIGNYLEDKVKPLWPKGWMQKSLLYKTSEVVHKHFTNPLAKKALPKDKPLTPKQPFQQAPQLSALTSSGLTSALTSSGLTSGLTPSPGSQVAKALSDGGKGAGGGGKTLLVGGAKSGGGSVIVGGVKSGLTSLVKGGTKNVPILQKPVAGSSKNVPILQKPSAAGTSKSLHTIQPKTTQVAPKLANPKVAIPKSTTSASSNPAKSVTTYLLSASSMDIAQLLKMQAQLKQKTGQQSGVLVNTATGRQTKGQGSSSQSIQLMPSSSRAGATTVTTPSAQDVGSTSRSGLCLSTSDSSGKGSTVVSTTATRATPSIVQPPQPAGRPPARGSVPVLPRHRLTTTDNSKLEAVVSSIVSAINTQSPLLTQQASPSPQASASSAAAAVEIPSPARLSLTRKDFSPQLIFPAQSTMHRDPIKAPATSSETTPSSGDRLKAVVHSSGAGDHSKKTPRSGDFPLITSGDPLSRSLPWSGDPLGGPPRHPIPGVLSRGPPNPARHSVVLTAPGPHHSKMSPGSGLAVAPPTSAGHAPIAPCVLPSGVPAGATPTLAIGGSLGPRLTPNAAVVSIPDTPPLLPQNHTPQQGESPLPLSPSLSSPVEQIFEEHSYLENNSSPFFGTELDASKDYL